MPVINGPREIGVTLIRRTSNVLYYILVFEGEPTPVRSIFWILVTYSIIEVPFITQTRTDR